LTLDDDQSVMWRSVLESIGFDYMEICDLYRSAGVDLQRLTVAEGGSRSSLWNQIKSDMLDAEVVRYKNAGGAVVTNCIFAAYAVKDVPEIIPELSKILQIDQSYQPRAENTKLYRELLNLQRKLIDVDMAPAFATLWNMKKILPQKQN